MPLTARYLQPQIEADLARKMVFVAGPRQVGKTTLARSLPYAKTGYLNWDVAEHRERILRRELPVSKLWIFDEIHKYRSWRGFLKGLYDGRLGGQRILVTGSARLDFYRHGGDSLQGRYHLLRLHPFSAAELGLERPAELRQLLKLGGFPEPFLTGSAVEARRWSREYRTLLVREEVTSLERVQDLGNLELLILRLPELVGSPLSINALREDLQVSHKAVASWIDILERLYAVFRVPPFAGPKIRAVKKEQKLYHLDWSLVPADPAALREPRRLPPLEMGPPRAGRRWSRPRAAVLPRHRRPRGGLRRCGEAPADPARRGEVGRRRARQEPALLEAQVSEGRRLADQRDREEGLRDARGDSRRPGVKVARGARLNEASVSGSAGWAWQARTWPRR